METKIYKIKPLVILFVISGLLLFGFIGPLFFLVYNKESTIFQQLIMFLSIIIAIGGSWAIIIAKIGIDEKKLTLFNTVNILPLFKGEKMRKGDISLQWNEIGEVDAVFVLYPESPIITLKPKEGVNKEPIGFLVGVGGMPLDLLKDILSHLSPDAKVSLYPYLKRKLEGKQTWFYVK